MGKTDSRGKPKKLFPLGKTAGWLLPITREKDTYTSMHRDNYHFYSGLTGRFNIYLPEKEVFICTKCHINIYFNPVMVS